MAAADAAGLVSAGPGDRSAPRLPARCVRGNRVAKRGYCEVGAGFAPVSGQALQLLHIVWLFVLGAAVLFGFL